MKLVICVFFIGCFSMAFSLYQKYDYETLYFKQKIDHFSFTNSDTYKQRYLVSEKHWLDKGPIFFYAGNEGDITLFAQNTGFMWEIAPEFRAMVIFAEHRYYGKSMPYGKNAFLNQTFTGFLTSSQALADYAELLTSIRMSKNAKECPVIVFGGSYGGMLAAWFRMKYPHIVQGAIAASAPILQFIRMTPCNKFGELVTRDYDKASIICSDVIRYSWRALNTVAAKKNGLDWISKEWKLCKPLKSKADLQSLKDYLTNVWINLAMVDYPYPASFLAPLPAYPINMVCNQLTNSSLREEALINELFKGLSVYFNTTHNAKCLDYHQEASSLLSDQGWNYQACTEMVMPFCYGGVDDFFEPQDFNYKKYANDCYKKFNVMPRPNMVAIEYGGKELHAASNIVFSNGLLDPWSTGGVMKNISSSVVAITIPEGAHHLDLRQADPNDPQSVVTAREFEKAYIYRWIKEFNALHPKKNKSKNSIH